MLEVNDGEVTSYPGSFPEYLRDRAATEDAESHEPAHVDAPEAMRTEAVATTRGSLDLPQSAVRRLNPIRLRQIEERCAFLEEEVPRLEAAIATTEAELARFVSAEETQRQSNLLEALRTQLAAAIADWEETMQVLEEQSSAV